MSTTITYRVSSRSGSKRSPSASKRMKADKDKIVAKGRTTDAKAIDMRVVKALLKDMSNNHGHVRVNQLRGEDEAAFRKLDEIRKTAEGTLQYETFVHY